MRRLKTLLITKNTYFCEKYKKALFEMLFLNIKQNIQDEILEKIFER